MGCGFESHRAYHLGKHEYWIRHNGGTEEYPPTVTSSQAPISEPLRDFLGDWRVHLRAKNRRPRTILSYLECGTGLCDWLDQQSYGVNHTDVTARVLETYLAEMQQRLSPATVAKIYRS